MVRKNRRKPTSPGEILRYEFLEPFGLSQKDFASHIGCDYKVINRIVNEKASIGNYPNGQNISSSWEEIQAL